MKIKRNMFILVIFLVCILAISSASAAEDNANDIISIDNGEAPNLEDSSQDIILDDSNEEPILEKASNDNLILENNENENTLSVSDDNTPLTATLSFAQLNVLINSNEDSEIYLDYDYTYSDADLEFKEGILINRAVTIYGNGHTLDGNGLEQARIFKVSNSSAVFRDIIFKNGYSTNNGGAIHGKSTVINCTFDDNTATNGGAMGDGTAINCTFINNYAYKIGGAMYYGTAINCTFTSNYAYEYAGAMYYGSAYNCTFDYNRANTLDGKYGGALYESFARNCTFIHNAAGYGGAMFHGTAINCTFDSNRCSMSDNYAIQRGVALNCIFINNTYDAYTTACTEMKFEFGDFTTRYDSGVNLTPNLYANNSYHDRMAYGTTVSIYKDGELIRTENITSSKEWAVILEPGTYTATFVVPLIPEVEPHTININILKRNVTIEAQNITVKYNSGENLIVFLRDERKDIGIADLTIAVDVDGTVENYTSNETGYVSIPLNGLAIGNHEVTLTLNDHPHYNDASAEASVTIVKRQAIIVCDEQFESEYNASDLFTITLMDDLNEAMVGAELVLDLTGETYITDENGQIKVPASKFAGGEHTAVISCSDDEYCFGTNKTINIIIAKQDSEISAINLTTKHGSNDKLNATLINHQGNPIVGATLTLDLTGETYITDSNGQIQVPIKSLAGGTYDAIISFDGNENYTASSATSKITINKELTFISASPTMIFYGADSYLYASFMDNWQNYVKGIELYVDVTGKTYVTDERGRIYIYANELAAGDYNVSISFSGNENYTESNKTVGLTIIESPTSMYADDVTAFYNEDKNFTINVKDRDNNPVPHVKIRVYLDELEELWTDDNGQVNIPVNGMDIGKYNVIAFFDGNQNYTESSTIGSITIKPRNIIVSVDSSDIRYGEESVIAFTVKDIDGNNLSGDLNVSIGQINETVTLNDGAVELKFNLSAGNYLVVASYDMGGLTYLGTDTFKVDKAGSQIIFKDMETNTVNIDIDGRIGEYFQVTLVDENGKALANKPIQIGFNGKVYNRTTNETGGASLQINLARADIYTFAVAFLGDENYTGTFVVAKITTKKTTPKLVVSNKSYKASASTKTITATLKSNKGNAIANKKVTVTVNGKSYSATTNDKGVATVKVSLTTKGTYTVTTKFAGDDTFMATSTKSTLKLT